MASERFVAALTEQIAREFAAAHQYVAIGNYYSAETFPQLTSFFYDQAEEEREHAMKMVNYLIDMGIQPDIGGPSPHWVCEDSGRAVAALGHLGEAGGAGLTG